MSVEQTQSKGQLPSVGSGSLVSREAMMALGFTEKWPGGNPKEPWWENPVDMPGVWFTERPTVERFWNDIAKSFRQQGRDEVRELLKKAIG